MKVNRRTVLLLIIVIVVVVGVYAITQWQRSRETANLLTALKSDDHGEAMKAMAALRDRGRSIQEQLIANLHDTQNANARWRSAVLLGSVHTTAARDALEAVLDDPNDDVRMDAAMSLGKVGGGRAAEALRNLAMNEDEEIPVRTAAVRALTLLRSGAHLPEIAELAADRPEVYPEGEEPEDAPEDDAMLLRKAAVAGVGVLGAAADPEIGERVGKGAETAAEAAMNVLSDSASDELEPNLEVRAAACTAIADLVEGVADDELAKKGLRTLMRVLREDESGSVRIAAMDAINQIPVPQDMVEQVDQAREDAQGDPHYWVRAAADLVGN
ncbi:MAG: HEAT repeat domain-containing protein [Armatimonadetes bacterium]|nr:HEAT repeat domain-containing protein [Armatimonadota bacterium]